MKDYVYLLLYRNFYAYHKSDTIGMCILGLFLTSDMGPFPCKGFIDWVNDDESNEVVSGNLTTLEKKDGFIVLSNEYLQEEVPTEIKIPHDKFLNILLEWRDKICKEKPKGVIIRQQDGKFFFETKNCTLVLLNKNTGIKQEITQYVYFKLQGASYTQQTDTIGMYILGGFLALEVGLSPSNIFIDWVNDDASDSTNSDWTYLEKEDDCIVLSEIHFPEKVPTKLKIPQDQFLNILLEWRDKICKELPKDVVLRQENGQYIFETKDLIFVDPCAD